MGFYSAIKKEEILLFVTTWTNVEDTETREGPTDDTQRTGREE